jgi:hypothetical protein
VVDVVDVGLVALRAEVHDVADDGQEVLGADVLDALGRRLVAVVAVELAVDAEPTDLAEAVSVLVEELLLEERPRLLDLRGVARTQPAVDLQQGRLVLGDLGEEVQSLGRQRIEDERVGRVRDRADRLEVRALDRLDGRADLGADAAAGRWS